MKSTLAEPWPDVRLSQNLPLAGALCPPSQARVSLPLLNYSLFPLSFSIDLGLGGPTDQPHWPRSLNHTSIASPCGRPSGDPPWPLSECCSPRALLLSASLQPCLSLGFTNSPPAWLVLPTASSCSGPGTSHDSHLEAFSPSLHCAPLLLQNPRGDPASSWKSC